MYSSGNSIRLIDLRKHQRRECSAKWENRLFITKHAIHLPMQNKDSPARKRKVNVPDWDELKRKAALEKTTVELHKEETIDERPALGTNAGSKE